MPKASSFISLRKGLPYLMPLCINDFLLDMCFLANITYLVFIVSARKKNSVASSKWNRKRSKMLDYVNKFYFVFLILGLPTFWIKMSGGRLPNNPWLGNDVWNGKCTNLRGLLKDWKKKMLVWNCVHHCTVSLAKI